MTLPQIIEKWTVAPARILGIPAGTLSVGSDADVVIFDPNSEWIPDAENLRSNSKNCAVLGRKLRGQVAATICKGKIVFSRKD